MAVDKRNIVLVGMPAVGKSTIGVLLAKQLRYNYVDSDIVIQVNNDATLAELIAAHGNDGFLRIEAEALKTLGPTRSVIATGGSAVYSDDAMHQLRQTGPVVYIRLGVGELASRLGDLKARGVVLKPGQTFAQLFAERAPLYERYADVVVDTTGLSLGRSVEKVAGAMRRWLRLHPFEE